MTEQLTLGIADPPTELSKMTTEKLREFVQDVLAGRIFVAEQVRRAEDIPMVFMPIIMGALSDWPMSLKKQIGTIWEYNDLALPRSINGYPCFASCHILHTEDWERAKKAIAREQRHMKEIEV